MWTLNDANNVYNLIDLSDQRRLSLNQIENSIFS